MSVKLSSGALALLPREISRPNYGHADLKAGMLLSQLSMAARKELGGTKWMMLEILGPDGTQLSNTQLERTFAPNSDGTHSFAINHSGHYVMRLDVRGTSRLGSTSSSGSGPRHAQPGTKPTRNTR